MRTLKILSGLGVSAVAFAVLAASFVWTAEATTRPVAIAPEPAPSVTAEPAEPARAAIEAPAEPEAEAVAPAAEEPAEEPAVNAITVPELTGRTALRAFRQARALGLVADIRDPEGNVVPAEERLYMRVTEQAIPAGGTAPEGWTVRLEARYPRAGFASGY